jgi:hypothetical protein
MILDLAFQGASLSQETKSKKPINVFLYWKVNSRNRTKPLRSRSRNYRKKNCDVRIWKAVLVLELALELEGKKVDPDIKPGYGEEMLEIAQRERDEAL